MTTPQEPIAPTKLLDAAVIKPSAGSSAVDNTTEPLLTPEQLKRIELSRLKGESQLLSYFVLHNDTLLAKARQREARARAEPSSTVNANNKRPLAVTLATSTSPTAPSKRAYEKKNGDDDGLGPLKKNTRLSNYFEYDLSKMVNTKGGFLLDEDGGPGKGVDEEVRRREKLREKERIAKNAEPCESSHRHRKFINVSCAVRLLDPTLNPKCRECGSLDIDHVYNQTFRCLVCNACKNTYPEKYSLLTKTECKEVRHTISSVIHANVVV